MPFSLKEVLNSMTKETTTFQESSKQQAKNVTSEASASSSKVAASSNVAAMIDLKLTQPTDFKLDTNTQSIIEKILEEQLKQSIVIDAL
ncbi:hypothetical protein RclHR1_10690013 [Rhizophagus clarus]|uniref:Uncharacterized protein n=1 Tax=Rhizophagus clarus TaxID=94130 RepID=A0A2Z6Q298_9GLOM|nr:hypothetical protein RclHR1_10690013 [Rhizophagus clarus]